MANEQVVPRYRCFGCNKWFAGLAIWKYQDGTCVGGYCAECVRVAHAKRECRSMGIPYPPREYIVSLAGEVECLKTENESLRARVKEYGDDARAALAALDAANA